VACGGVQHYWIIFKHEAWWLPRRFFIYFGPLLNSLKNQRTGLKLRFSIPSGRYPHHGVYEWDYSHLWPFFNPISPSWVYGQGVKMQALKSIRDLLRHKNSSRLHFGHRWFMHIGCANGFPGFATHFLDEVLS